MRNIDQRQVGTFLESPSVQSKTSTEQIGGMSEYVSRERTKTKVVAQGGLYIPETGELVSKEELEKVPLNDRKLLKDLGVEGFNKFCNENVKLEDGSWLSKKTTEYKVLDAIADGYSTYEEIKQVTGLATGEIESAIKNLERLGVIK